MTNQTPIGTAGASNTTRLHPEDLQVILTAVRVQSPWLDAKEAAEYLRLEEQEVIVASKHVQERMKATKGYRGRLKEEEG